MSSPRSAPVKRRELVPGEVIRFRNRRRFFTSASMALGPLAVGIPVFVFTFAMGP